VLGDTTENHKQEETSVRIVGPLGGSEPLISLYEAGVIPTPVHLRSSLSHLGLYSSHITVGFQLTTEKIIIHVKFLWLQNVIASFCQRSFITFHFLIYVGASCFKEVMWGHKHSSCMLMTAEGNILEQSIPSTDRRVGSHNK
jgi:hypothetical protein